VRLLYFGCLVAGVAAALLAAGEAALSAESAEGGPPPNTAETETNPAQAPAPGAATPRGWVGGEAGPAGSAPVEVIRKLISARSSLRQTQVEFSWVIGPAGVSQQALEGRVSIVDATHYRVEFGLPAAEGGGGNVVLVPDGRWACQFSNVPGQVGLRMDLAYLKEQVRDPLPRVAYDPTGGVLLELLAERGYVTYEGDEDLDVGRCAVLSYEGRSFRNPAASGSAVEADPTVRTRLHYRYDDGLLVAEEEVDGKGRFLSTYRLRAPHRFEPPADLFQVPEYIHCIDTTRQFVRRLLYGPPPGAQPAGAATGLP